MGVTRLLLLGPFYNIQTNFLYFFAHDCKCLMPSPCSGKKLTSILVTDYIQTERETETDILLPWNQIQKDEPKVAYCLLVTSAKQVTLSAV